MSCTTNIDVIRVFARKLLPLLHEYFYGSEANLLLVVGDRFGGAHNIFNIERRDEAFTELFGLNTEAAAEMGYREHDTHVSLSVDPRFWDANRLVPGPRDEDYAVSALIKVYQPLPTGPNHATNA